MFHLRKPGLLCTYQSHLSTLVLANSHTYYDARYFLTYANF